MRPRRALLAALAGATLVGSTLAAPAAATPIDNGPDADLAAAQFTIHLLTKTDLRPSDVTCTPPPTLQAGGDLLCFALVSTPTGRQTISAIATLEEPGTYTFTAVTKPAIGAVPTAPSPTEPVPTEPSPSEPVPSEPPPSQPTDPESADQAVLDTLAEVTGDPEGLQAALVDDEPEVVSVDELTYHEPTVTLIVAITSSAATDDRRNELAYYVTDRLALLWEPDQPFRAEAATIRPRLEVAIDGKIYGTPYDVMVRVADFTIEYEEWLDITTTAGTGTDGSGVAPAQFGDVPAVRPRPSRASAVPAPTSDTRVRITPATASG